MQDLLHDKYQDITVHLDEENGSAPHHKYVGGAEV
jgi:hypothetical protein